MEVVALCDVDRNNLAAAAKRAPGARLYTDWREMLAKEADRIDSINAAVPDHMHAAIAMAALRAGKHVYCQKPLCHDVAEVRALTELAVKSGKVTQLGTQHASGIGDRMAVEYLRSGVIGKVKHVYLGSNRTGAKRYRLEGPRPEKTEAPPAHLDWDLWLGTAPERWFSPVIYHHFLDACLGKEMTESHFGQSGPMTEAILLGTVAIRHPGKILEWDAKALAFPNAPEAEQHVRRTYRKGWEVEGV